MARAGRLLTQAEYARRRKISRQAIGEAITAGRIPFVWVKVKRGKSSVREKRIDPAVADAEMDENTDQSKPRNHVTGNPGAAGDSAPKPATGKIAANRAVREYYLALTAKLDYLERAGQLVRKDALRHALIKKQRTACEMLNALPDALVPALLVAKDATQLYRLLTDEFQRICDELSGEIH